MNSIEHLRAVADTLTTPEKEDWTLLVDGDTVYWTAVRMIDDRPVAISFVATPGDVKALLLDKGRPSRTGLGLVSVYYLADSAERGALDLLAWIVDRGRRTRGFNVMTIPGGISTAEAVARWLEMAEGKNLPEGATFGGRFEPGECPLFG